MNNFARWWRLVDLTKWQTEKSQQKNKKLENGKTQVNTEYKWSHTVVRNKFMNISSCRSSVNFVSFFQNLFFHYVYSTCWAFPNPRSRDIAVCLFSGLLQKCVDPRWRHTRLAEIWRDRDICEALSSHGNTVILQLALWGAFYDYLLFLSSFSVSVTFFVLGPYQNLCGFQWFRHFLHWRRRK